MNFEEFCNKSCEYINSIYDDVKVSVISVTKNNGCRLTGLSFHKEDATLAPTLYLESYFKLYEGGMNFYAVCDDIIASYDKAQRESAPDFEFLNKYDKVRELILCRIINKDKNAELLKNVPYVDCLDLAIVFYLRIAIGDNEGSILVRNGFLDDWEVDLGALYNDALSNTIARQKLCIYSIEDVLIDILADRKDEETVNLVNMLESINRESDTAPMYVLTNKDKWYGAAAMLDHDSMGSFATRINNDFYILPSSIHELIIVPDSQDITVESLRQMVVEVNSTQVSDEEFLSDNVYKYVRSLGRVIVA